MNCHLKNTGCLFVQTVVLPEPCSNEKQNACFAFTGLALHDYVLTLHWFLHVYSVLFLLCLLHDIRPIGCLPVTIKPDKKF